jgi:hypothetical protein
MSTVWGYKEFSNEFDLQQHWLLQVPVNYLSGMMGKCKVVYVRSYKYYLIQETGTSCIYCYVLG